MYILDTNAVSALMRGEPRVVQRLRAADRSEVAVPHPVFAEIVYGIERLPRSRRRTDLEHRSELLRSELQRAEWTDGVSDAFGRIKAALERNGRRIEDFDAAIAAHALAVQGVLVTANVDQMIRVPGIAFEDWTAEE